MDLETVRALLAYDPHTGKLVWKVKRAANADAGDEAGFIDGQGYRRVRVLRQHFRAHRLIWWLHCGQWPLGVIDHINRDRDDNRISNLRDTSVLENSRNRITPVTGRLATPPGVRQVGSRFYAYINLGRGRQKCCGGYASIEAAQAAREATLRRGV